MKTETMIAKLQGIGRELCNMRDGMGERQKATGAYREISAAITKVIDTLTALGA